MIFRRVMRNFATGGLDPVTTQWLDDNYTAIGEGGSGAALTKLADQEAGVAESVVPHGLDHIPDTVLLTSHSAAYAWQSQAADATNVYIKMNMGGTSSSHMVINTVSPVGLVLVDTGVTETILPGCDLVTDFDAGVVIGWTIWFSTNIPNIGKQSTIRLRRTNVAGAVLATVTFGATGDSTAGHDQTTTSSYSDVAPTDGHYVLTIQNTNGDSATSHYSDIRTFSLTSVYEDPPNTVDVYVA